MDLAEPSSFQGQGPFSFQRAGEVLVHLVTHPQHRPRGSAAVYTDSEVDYKLLGFTILVSECNDNSGVYNSIMDPFCIPGRCTQDFLE